jgi:hypothetical protein
MSALEALDLTGKGLNAFSVLLTLKRRLFQLSNLSKKCAFSTFFVFFPVQSSVSQNSEFLKLRTTASWCCSLPCTSILFISEASSLRFSTGLVITGTLVFCSSNNIVS